MNEEWTSAREDLSIIKTMLEQTMTGLRELAGFFTLCGIVWLIYAVAATALHGVMAAGSLAYVRYSDVQAGILEMNYLISLMRSLLELGLYAALAAIFLFRRRREKKAGLNAYAMKLLDIWGVCLGVFILLFMGTETAMKVLNYVVALPDRNALVSGSAYITLQLGCLFPVLPLLITAVYSEHRGMLLLGIIALALELSQLFWLPGMDVIVSDAQEVLLWGAYYFARKVIPAVTLLLFGHLLKKDGTHGAA